MAGACPRRRRVGCDGLGPRSDGFPHRATDPARRGPGAGRAAGPTRSSKWRLPRPPRQALRTCPRSASQSRRSRWRPGGPGAYRRRRTARLWSPRPCGPSRGPPDRTIAFPGAPSRRAAAMVAPRGGSRRDTGRHPPCPMASGKSSERAPPTPSRRRGCLPACLGSRAEAGANHVSSMAGHSRPVRTALHAVRHPAVPAQFVRRLPPGPRSSCPLPMTGSPTPSLPGCGAEPRHPSNGGRVRRGSLVGPLGRARRPQTGVRDRRRGRSDKVSSSFRPGIVSDIFRAGRSDVQPRLSRRLIIGEWYRAGARDCFRQNAERRRLLAFGILSVSQEGIGRAYLRLAIFGLSEPWPSRFR